MRIERTRRVRERLEARRNLDLVLWRRLSLRLLVKLFCVAGLRLLL